MSNDNKDDEKRQLELLNKQISDMREEKEHNRTVVKRWVIGIIVAAVIIFGIWAAVNDINYHKQQLDKSINDTACSVYPTEQERQDCENGQDD